MGRLTDRGEAVAAGYAALATNDGDDTLSRPDAPAETAGAEQDPADIPAPPEGYPAGADETASDVDADARETRSTDNP